MNELSVIFDSDLITAIFCFSSIAFLLLYVAGFILLQRWSRTSGRISAIHRHVISGLGATLVAMGMGFGLHAANVAMASARAQLGATTSISLQELHRSIRKSLPVQKFEDQTYVFPNRDGANAIPHRSRSASRQKIDSDTHRTDFTPRDSFKKRATGRQKRRWVAHKWRLRCHFEEVFSSRCPKLAHRYSERSCMNCWSIAKSLRWSRQFAVA